MIEIKIGNVYSFITNRNKAVDVIADSISGDVAVCHTVKEYGKKPHHSVRKLKIERLMLPDVAVSEVARREQEKKREEEEAEKLRRAVFLWVNHIPINPIEVTRDLRRKTRKIGEDGIYKFLEDMIYSTSRPEHIPSEFPPDMVEEYLRESIRDSDVYILTGMELVADAETAHRIV